MSIPIRSTQPVGPAMVAKRAKPPKLPSLFDNKNKLLPVISNELELFGSVDSDPPTTSTPNESGLGTAGAVSKTGSSKAALQKLAKSFAALNKRKAEKREREQNTWKGLIQGALQLQKGKIPLLLAVEAGNQSMCRELLSSQTADQLKVSVWFMFSLSCLIRSQELYLLTTYMCIFKDNSCRK